jgi:hypothetical protein
MKIRIFWSFFFVFLTTKINGRVLIESNSKFGGLKLEILKFKERFSNRVKIQGDKVKFLQKIKYEGCYLKRRIDLVIYLRFVLKLCHT